jgi:hypothetical protein
VCEINKIEMLFHHMTEYSDQATTTMNGQQTMNRQNVGDNQLGWQQFSNQIRQRENERVEFLEECRFNRKHEQDAKFLDVEVSTPRRQASSSSSSSGARRAVVKFQLAAPAVEEEETPTMSHYEVVQKPKTRAARRTIEEEEEEDMTATVNPSSKRERRSEYWVQQNDKRRSAARTFKLTAAAAME